MLTKEECLEALTEIKMYGGINIPLYSLEVIENLIDEHFDNPPLEWEERVKLLEKQLDIAIKHLCLTAKGSDACNSLDNLYEGIKEMIEEQARKEVKDVD